MDQWIESDLVVAHHAIWMGRVLLFNALRVEGRVVLSKGVANQ